MVFFRSSLGASLVLFFGIICIGFSAIFVKLADVPGSVSSFYRLFFAALAIVPVWLLKGRKTPQRRDLGLIVKGSFFFAIDLFLWNSAILLTSAATATLLANNAPIWVGLISWLVFRERLSRSFWMGLWIAMVGLNILIGIESWLDFSFNHGDLMALAAGFFYALYLLYSFDVRKRIDTLTFMTFSVLVMVVLLFFLNLILGHPFWGFSTKTWLALVGLGVVSHFSGWLAINYALGFFNGVKVSVTLLSQAIVTALFGLIILGESLSLNQIVGGMVVLVGIFVVYRR